ncbi:MAG TPA: helix-turn-helix domain-containing protein, partial [Candidatus Enterococcus avicola]|nr:helix-turn-helix domain-containing protein [Candidatus Enterococcus avicola]
MDLKEQAKQDYLAGMKIKDIAQKIGKSASTIRSWKSRYKWDDVSDKVAKAATKSVATKRNNNELTKKYGWEPKYDKHGSFKLFGVKIVVAFTNSERGVGAVRGMTAYGAYINEASLANRAV